MIKKILIGFGLLLLVFIAVILFNTLSTKPWPAQPADRKQEALPDSAVQHLSEAVQIATISAGDTSAIDTMAFRAFNTFIERAYPLVHKHLTKKTVNEFSFVFEWKGQHTQLAPIILMGHYDVVPVEPSTIHKWIEAPFSGMITDSCVWGRGSIDDKSGVISILEATEALLRKGVVPPRTFYLCFGHDEETGGSGARAIVQYLEENKVRAEMVLDEGGEMTQEKIKEIKRPIAAIGVAEKGYASFGLSVQKEGGHSMMPDKETSIDILATALYKLRKESLPAKLTPAVNEFIHRISTSSDNFMNKMAASNMWLFKGVIIKKLSARPEGNAMLHTTIVPTIVESGIKDNIVPASAKAIVNCRILPGETAETVKEFIRKTIQDDRVVIEKIDKFDSDPSTGTDIQSPAFKRVESAIYRNIPDVLPTPYLMIGATDSRYYRRISDGVVNFFPATDSKGYHGINERLLLTALQRGINFYMTIIEESSKEFK
jgi:carboxypeptidase PM20D1